jgi:hypothetical protein
MGNTNWRDHGVNVIPAHTADPNTAQTLGLDPRVSPTLAWRSDNDPAIDLVHGTYPPSWLV